MEVPFDRLIFYCLWKTEDKQNLRNAVDLAIKQTLSLKAKIIVFAARFGGAEGSLLTTR